MQGNYSQREDSRCLRYRAKESARRKQQRIFEATRKDYVLRDWYLEILTEEAMTELSFSEYTAIRNELIDEKKESARHTAKALTNHFVL